MSNNKAFRQHNGFLRLLSLVFGLIAIGLTVSKFRRSELNEIIYLSTLTFGSCVSLLHFLISVLTPCSREGKCFKIADFVFHFCDGMLLLVTSVMMIQVAAKKGKVLDYRFQDTKVVLVRAAAGIFGMQTSFLYFLVAYLTITQKQLMFCIRLPKPPKKGTDGSAGGEGQIPSSNNNNDGEAEASPESSATPKTYFRCFVDRFTWRRLLVDEVLEARVFTVLLGMGNVGLLAHSYDPNNEVEEFFFSLVLISLSLTLISQVVYAFGILNLKESTSSLVDCLIHYVSSASLLVGGVLMMGSVIQNNSYGYQYKAIERTATAMIGVIGGFFYGYVATDVKRRYFTHLRGIAPPRPENPSTSKGKSSRSPNAEESKTQEDPYKYGCAMS